MKQQSTFGLVSHIAFAVLGLLFVWRGLRAQAKHRSLLMGMKGQAAVPMGVGLRIVTVVLGAFLTIISTLPALGVVK